MLKVLLKKQLMEVFRSYFYNAKKNKPRSKAEIIGFFLLYAGIMLVILGGMFTALSVTLCSALVTAGVGWLYFVIMSGIAILLGAFGSVFNTYAGLYLGKDNDLLLSMPIPIKDIILSRLINVWLLGTMYSAVAILPALIVYWCSGYFSLPALVCGLLLLLLITLIVLILSCLLGWCVAKISLKLKNKSIVTVLASLAFIGIYYVCYFKAADAVEDLLVNAVLFGEKIKGAAYGLYLFGRIGEGSLPAALLFSALILLILLLTWLLLKRTFLSIAISSGKTSAVRKTAKAAGQKSPFRAMLSKEIARFTSSPNYMLNCGLGMLLIPVAAVVLLIKSGTVMETMTDVFGAKDGAVAVLFACALCLLNSMNDMAVPSLSLEGKNFWIYRSLPVESKTILRAKTVMQLLLTGIPMLFAAICLAITVPASPAVRLAAFLLPLVFTAFSAVVSTSLGLISPNLHWTNELTVIKQSFSVLIAIFGSWILAALIALPYMLLELPLGTAAYLFLWILVLGALTALLQYLLDTRGAKRIENL